MAWASDPPSLAQARTSGLSASAAILARRSLSADANAEGLHGRLDAASCGVSGSRPTERPSWPAEACRPMQTPRVCMADWTPHRAASRVLAQLSGHPGPRPRSRCTAADRRHAQEPVCFACTARRTITQEHATAKSAGDEHVSDRRHSTSNRRPATDDPPLAIDRPASAEPLHGSRSEARAGAGVLCLHRTTHHHAGACNGKVRRRRACLRPAALHQQPSNNRRRVSPNPTPAASRH